MEGGRAKESVELVVVMVEEARAPGRLICAPALVKSGASSARLPRLLLLLRPGTLTPCSCPCPYIRAQVRRKEAEEHARRINMLFPNAAASAAAAPPPPPAVSQREKDAIEESLAEAKRGTVSFLLSAP